MGMGKDYFGAMLLGSSLPKACLYPLLKKGKKLGLNVKKICEKVITKCPKQDAYLVMQMYKNAPKSRKIANAQKSLLQDLYKYTNDI